MRNNIRKDETEAWKLEMITAWFLDFDVLLRTKIAKSNSLISSLVSFSTTTHRICGVVRNTMLLLGM